MLAKRRHRPNNKPIYLKVLSVFLVCAVLLWASGVTQQAYNLIEANGTPATQGSTLNLANATGITWACSTVGVVTTCTPTVTAGLTAVTPYATDGTNKYILAPALLPVNLWSQTGFNWSDQGSASVTTNTNGDVTFTDPGPSTANDLRTRYFTVGSATAFTATVAFINQSIIAGFATVGLGFFASSSTASRNIMMVQNSTLPNDLFLQGRPATSTTSGVGSSFFSFGTAFARGQIIWFRIKDDLTHKTYFVSYDGEFFTQQFQEASSSLTTDSAALSLCSQGAGLSATAPDQIQVLSFKITTP